MKHIVISVLLLAAAVLPLSAGELETTNAISTTAVRALTNRVNGRIYGEIQVTGSTSVYWGYTSNAVASGYGTLLRQYDLAAFGRQATDPWDGEVWLITVSGSSAVVAKDRW